MDSKEHKRSIHEEDSENVIITEAEMKKLHVDANFDLSLLYKKRERTPTETPKETDDDNSINSNELKENKPPRTRRRKSKLLTKEKSRTPVVSKETLLEIIPEGIHNDLNEYISDIQHSVFPVLVTNKKTGDISLGLLDLNNEAKTTFSLFDSEKGQVKFKKADVALDALLLVLVEKDPGAGKGPVKLNFCSATVPFRYNSLHNKGTFLLYAHTLKPIPIVKNKIPRIYFVLNNTSNENDGNNVLWKNNIIFFNYKDYHDENYDNFNKNDCCDDLSEFLSKKLNEEIIIVKSKTLTLKSDIFKLCELYKNYDSFLNPTKDNKKISIKKVKKVSFEEPLVQETKEDTVEEDDEPATQTRKYKYYKCNSCQKKYSIDEIPYNTTEQHFCCGYCFKCTHSDELACSYCLDNVLYKSVACAVCFTSKLNKEENETKEEIRKCIICSSYIHKACMVYKYQEKYSTCATCLLNKIVKPLLNKDEKIGFFKNIDVANSDTYAILNSIETEIKIKVAIKNLHHKSLERLKGIVSTYFEKIDNDVKTFNLSNNWLNYTHTFIPESRHKVEDDELTENPMCRVCMSGFCKKTSKIQCSYCCEFYHSYCINVTDNINRKIDKWACPECAVCIICQKEENEHLLVACDNCDTYIHLYCHTPPLDAVPTNAFNCLACSMCMTCGKYATEKNYSLWIGSKECHDCKNIAKKKHHDCKKFCVECSLADKANLNKNIQMLSTLIKQKLNRLQLLPPKYKDQAKTASTSIENDELVSPNKIGKCALCNVCGNNYEFEDRLVLIGLDDVRAHLNCIIWSVGLDKEGRINTRKLREVMLEQHDCKACGQVKAFIKCSNKDCEDYFHFNCAITYKAAQREPKNFVPYEKEPEEINKPSQKTCFTIEMEFFCPSHMPSEKTLKEVFVNGEHYKNVFIRKNFILNLDGRQLEDFDDVNGAIQFGSLIIDSLGDVTKNTTDHLGILFTDRFKSRRLFTLYEKHKRVNVIYHLSIFVEKESCVFEVREGNNEEPLIRGKSIKQVYIEFIKKTREHCKESEKLQDRQYNSKAFGLNGYHLFGIGLTEVQSLLNKRLSKFNN
eukprot:GAHX01001437.1.p1 GENE.GAHX01001437.1~~GAHX01001437.1.p1  ORF type:complete len:1076 (-),score=221.51 GAHX01001437.1:47-3274(-)